MAGIALSIFHGCCRSLISRIEPGVSVRVLPSSTNRMYSPNFDKSPRLSDQMGWALCGEDGHNHVWIFWSKQFSFKICPKMLKSTDFSKATFVNLSSLNVTDYLLLRTCVSVYLQGL